MYPVLTKLRQIETTPIGMRLAVLVKFRNNLDGIVDVHIQGPKGPAVSVEKSSDGYKAFAWDSEWIQATTTQEIFDWTLHKLAEIMGSQQLP